jgi:hypothetical protein
MTAAMVAATAAAAAAALTVRCCVMPVSRQTSQQKFMY